MNRTTIFRSLAGLAVAASALWPAALVSAAGEAEGTNVPPGSAGPQIAGFDMQINGSTQYVGAFGVRTEDGNVVSAFCVELGTPYPTTNAEVTLTSTAGSELRPGGDASRLPQAMWIASNVTIYDATGNPIGATVGTPIGGGYPAADRQASENIAAQLAIWHVVNGFTITDATEAVAEEITRATEFVDLVDGADNILGTGDDQTVELAPHAYTTSVVWNEAGANTGQLEVTVTATDSDNVTGPAAGVTVTLTADGTLDLDPAVAGTQDTITLTTAANGVATTGTLEAAGETTVTATAQITIDTGSLFTPANDDADNPRQQVITSAGSQIVRSDTVLVPAAAAPTTTVTPTTVPAETTTTTTPTAVTDPPATSTTVPSNTTPPDTTDTTPDDQTTDLTVTSEEPAEDLPRSGPKITMIAVIAAAVAGALGLTIVTRRRDTSDSD